MKRNHKDRHPHLRAHFPVFEWVECTSCGVDFRWEWGWRVLTGPYHGGRGVIRYICSSCASTRDEAHQVALSGPWKPSTPPQGPAPVPPTGDPAQ